MVLYHADDEREKYHAEHVKTILRVSFVGRLNGQFFSDAAIFMQVEFRNWVTTRDIIHSFNLKIQIYVYCLQYRLPSSDMEKSTQKARRESFKMSREKKK